MHDTDSKLVWAFSIEQVEKITGVSKSQLEYWDQTKFFSSSTYDVRKGEVYGRVYSFEDLVNLKVISDLRNKASVTLQSLREVKKILDDSGEKWIDRKLCALNKRVVFEDDDGYEDMITRQRVFNIDIRVEFETVKNNVIQLSERQPNSYGKIVKRNRVVSNKHTIAGTRIKVESIKAFYDQGYTIEQILEEYPSLERQDIEAAIRYKKTA